MSLPLRTSIDESQSAKLQLQEQTRLAVERYRYNQPDLIRQGLTRRAAQSALARFGVDTLGPDEYVDVPVDFGSEVVALVASRGDANSGALRTISQEMYLRTEGLKLPVWADAGYICSDHQGVISNIYPIEAHLRVGDIGRTKLPSGHPLENRLAALLQDSYVSKTWAACDAYFLGPGIPVNIQLDDGTGIAGTRHYRLTSLLSARRLSQVKTINQGG